MKHLPRVAAINDISSFGRCALTVIIPTMSAMGVQVCPVPTAVLSTHMGFAAPAVQDLSELMGQTTQHWRSLGLTFDAIYTGFLASHEQIATVEAFLDAFATKDTLVLVDPVMADHGSLYQCFDVDFAAHMNRFTQRASLITPNLTEAALLLGEDYTKPERSLDEYKDWARRLSGDSRDVVLTGVSLAENSTGALTYARETGTCEIVQAPLAAAQFPGTGDLFASVLLAAMVQGDNLASAAQRATDFVATCAQYTVEAGTPVMEGVQLEACLGKLM